MASSISITDAFERSIRVDYAVKSAVNEFYNLLKNVCVERGDSDTPLRFILGYMYCGGDDGAFIMPASLSIPFALYILNRYHELMGGKSTLSLAIVATKPKHPIIPLYEAADKLLHHAKSAGGRRLCYEFIHSQSLDRVSDRYRGAISILNVDTGRISEEYISDILGILWEDRVGIQNKHSYTLSSINNDDSILRLLRIAVPHITPNLYNLKNYVDKILQDIVLEYNEETSYIDLLRDVREIVKDTVSISVAGTSDVKVKISYVTARGHEAFKLIRDRKLIDKGTLASLLLYIDKDGYALKLIDLEFIIKLLSGGRI